MKKACNNDSWIRSLYFDADVTVAAWGNNGALLNRAATVKALLPQLYCLAFNQNGEPAHPLYLTSEATLKPFQINSNSNHYQTTNEYEFNQIGNSH